MDFSSFLDSRLLGNDRQDPLPRRCLWHRRPLPQWGEASCSIRLNVTKLELFWESAGCSMSSTFAILGDPASGQYPNCLQILVLGKKRWTNAVWFVTFDNTKT